MWGVQLLFGQLEKAPVTERIHAQLYVEFNKPVRLNQCKDIGKEAFGDAHWTLCNGSAQQNIVYCTKPETRLALADGGHSWRIGKAGSEAQGKRSDIDAMFDAIKAGASDKDLLENPETRKAFVRYHKVSKRLPAHAPCSANPADC